VAAWWIVFHVLNLPLQAEVKLPAIISDHMILQKSKNTRIWGNATPTERVQVLLGDLIAETVTGADGKWAVMMDLTALGQGPYQLTVRGENIVAVNDVAVGEVWVCSGQSNMEYNLSMSLGADDEVKTPRNPQLRQFRLKKQASLDPLTDCEGVWEIADASTRGTFTAVGYYFGKQLQQALSVPVGLINSSWGGTPCEAWMSEEGINQFEDLQHSKDRIKSYARQYPASFVKYKAEYLAWAKKYQRTDVGPENAAEYASPTATLEGWRTVHLPGQLQEFGLPDAGVIWLRRQLKTPAAVAQTFRPGLPLYLGKPRDFDTVYWNGKKIAATGFDSANSGERRLYRLPPELIEINSEATLAIRLESPSGGAGIDGDRYPFTADGMSLAGDWLAKVERSYPPLDDAARSARPVAPTPAPATGATATGLYNGMINPLVNYSIKGVVWYQGESNTGRAHQYRTTFPLLIRDWRAHWRQGEFPFYFCQLANHLEKKKQPGESAWAELREAQLLTLAVPATGMATLIDLGEEADIHPRDKREVGARLARLALIRNYNGLMPDQGPRFKSLTVVGSTVRVEFEHATGGLAAHALPQTYAPSSLDAARRLPLLRNSPGSEVDGFAICGAERQWQWADARIEGTQVIVSSPDVPQPVAVRYAWADNPTCNLYNGAGLPAPPFRTDDFPGQTEKGKY
jgi:sialate O-acetylesterase